jgi:hypothetical protein
MTFIDSEESLGPFIVSCCDKVVVVSEICEISHQVFDLLMRIGLLL